VQILDSLWSICCRAARVVLNREPAFADLAICKLIVDGFVCIIVAKYEKQISIYFCAAAPKVKKFF